LSRLGVGTSVKVSFFNVTISNPEVVNFESKKDIDPSIDSTQLEIQFFLDRFSIKDIGDLQALITVLDENFAPKLTALEEPFNMDDVIDFATQLKQIAKEFNTCTIKKYADSLYQAADEFDIIEIQKLIRLFNPILNQLKHQHPE